MKDVIDILLYFAKFPDRDGVLTNFSKTTEIIPGYSELRAQIEALPDPIFPQIKEFVYSSDIDELERKIKSISDIFLLVEFGPIVQSGKNTTGVKDIEWHFSITLAQKGNSRKYDAFEDALISNSLLNLLKDMIKQIEADDANRCKPSRLLDRSYTLAPIEPYSLMGAVGWALTFKKTATNLSF